MNYVKFRRGLIDDFNKLQVKESDTLYFVYDEDEAHAELWLGSKKITGEGGNNTSDQSLSNLKDVIITEIQNDNLLIYEDGEWVNKSIEDVIKNYMNLSTVTAIIVENLDNNTHQDLLAQEANNKTPINGDIIVIKDIIDTNCYQHTGYVYSDNQWIALDGNYKADNIYFNNDFIFTENVGTITIPESGNITVSAKGKNLQEFLTSIFAVEKNPEVVMPSATISIGNTTVFEVGTEYTPSYSIAFNSGEYSYGPNPTGVVASYTISDTNGNSSTKSSDSFNSFLIDDNTNYQIEVNISYSDGATPKTNLGNNCEEEKILANELNVKSSVIKGYRKSFYGALNDKNDYDIRSLKSSTSALKNGSSFTINLTSNTQRVVIAYPATLQNLTSVLDKNDSNSNIVSGFGAPQIVGFKGASEESSTIEYKVYTMDFANAYGTSNVFTVTI